MKLIVFLTLLIVVATVFSCIGKRGVQYDDNKTALIKLEKQVVGLFGAVGACSDTESVPNAPDQNNAPPYIGVDTVYPYLSGSRNVCIGVRALSSLTSRTVRIKKSNPVVCINGFFLPSYVEVNED